MASSKDYIGEPERSPTAGARAENLMVLAAVLSGVGIGWWAASTEKILEQETLVLLATATITAGLLGITVASMAIVLGFLTEIFGDLIEQLGLRAFFRPFKTVALISAIAALVSIVGAIDSASGSTDVRASLFGLATCVTVWAIIASAILVWKLADYAQLARRAAKVGSTQT
jgi:hypothetical protein